MNLKQIIDGMVKSYSLKKALNKIEVSPEQCRVLEDFRVNYVSMTKRHLKGLYDLKGSVREICKWVGIEEYDDTEVGARLLSKGIRVSPEEIDKMRLFYKTARQTCVRKVDEGIADLLNDYDGMFERVKKVIEIQEELQVPPEMTDKMNLIDKTMRQTYVALKEWQKGNSQVPHEMNFVDKMDFVAKTMRQTYVAVNRYYYP